MQSQPPPKGSLEDLFRHHLLESEAAAVPPRPLVWEHLDNSLLLAQNEKYRRRLLVHRWSLAASLLLAALAGGGWWHSQQLTTATLAGANEQRAAARQAVASAIPASSRVATGAAIGTLAATAVAAPRVAGWPAAGTATNSPATASSSVEQVGGSTALARFGQANRQSAATSPETTAASLARHNYAGAAAGALATATTSQVGRSGREASSAGGTTATRLRSYSSPTAYAIAATSTSFAAAQETRPLASPAGLSTEATSAEDALAENASAVASTANRMGEATLAARLATLALTPAAGLPAELALKEWPAPSPTLLRPWRYGAEYAISAFQPNIDFNRSVSEYNPALGLNTVSLTRAAAAEYRANLRAGLGQRLTLRATRWLGGHWSLSTGVEVAQQDAYSATSAAFTGEQLVDLSNFNASSTSSSSSTTYSNVTAPSRDLRESSFRYRSAGVPLELQYDNQAKSGLSFYGRLGAIVSALLNVRGEVAGNPEATRTYSLTSASTPYRRFTALLRGSAGMRYRPAGSSWGLHVGPTAEAGVQSMNAETDRSFLKQSRPYSVGIEAGIEFGGGFKAVSPFTN